MRIVRDYQFVEPRDRGASVAIGNFDGVHLGHMSVIDMARAAGADAPLGVLTFEPHPRAFFAPDAPPFRLMSSAARSSRLAKVGVERLYELNFNAGLSGLTPDAFARDVIKEGLGLHHVVIGADFCFGKGRAGSAADMIRFGEEMGFGVTVAPLLAHSETTVSSTAIRQALTDADPARAAAMLGHWHRIEGPVIGGEQRGRELGYPTANMSIDGLHPPAFGVYMFGENRPNLETFIFDFSGDLYGATLSVALVEFLRPEENFDGLDALITQMDADCARARTLLDAL